MISAAVVGLGRWGRNLVECTIKRMLEDGRLGRPLHIEGNFNGPSAYRQPKAHCAVHGVAVLEAIGASARSGRRETIG